MTFVVTDACIRCKYTDCVEVCPSDCFHEGANMLVIDADHCIDCGVCVPECPAEAIVHDTDARAGPWVALNATYAAQWPNIAHRKEALPNADAYRDEQGKFERYFSAEVVAVGS